MSRGEAAFDTRTTLTTYLLRLEGDPFDELARFIQRVQAIELPEFLRSTKAEIPIFRRN